MSAVQRIYDGLQNVVANLGTRRDKSSHTTYVADALPSGELLAIYRSSWLAAAIVDYPAEDATRKWRNWRADADQITKIEEVEKNLSVQKRVQDALVAARLYGGAAIYMSTEDGSQDQPLTPGTEIKSLVVLTSNSLRAGKVVRDINNPYYSSSECYNLTSGDNSQQIPIHASRLVIFRGKSLPDDTGSFDSVGTAWGGDSVLQSTIDSIKQTDETMANIASLVFEAKTNVYKFEGLAQLLAAKGGDAKLLSRLSSMTAMKGINGDVVIDMKDEFLQRTASFAGLPEVVAKFQDNVSGAAKIPVTRLFGRAAAGLSGSGDGDERVYYDRIGHMQAIDIGPAMSLLDECIIYQALGNRPAEIYYEWTPLRQLSEPERAEVFSKTATAARAIAGSSAGELIPLDALSDSLVNELTEMGVLPGLDQAVLKYGTLSEQDLPVSAEDEV